jgi:Planctomycete cytochrome C
MTLRKCALALLGLVHMLAVPVVRGNASSDGAPDVEWFETKVRPVLVDHCCTCHSAETKPAGGLRVDDRSGLLTGGNSGAAVVPGDPVASILLQWVSHKNPSGACPGRANHSRMSRPPRSRAGSATAQPGRR